MKKLEDIILETLSVLDEKDTTEDERTKQGETSFKPPKKGKETIKGRKSKEMDEEEKEDDLEDEEAEEEKPDSDDTIINFKNSTNYLHFKDYAVNQFRAGKSLDTNDEVEAYFERLPTEYKRFFFFVFRVLTQIMDGVEGDKAPLPDKYFKIDSKTTKSEKSGSKKLSKDLAPSMPNAKASKDATPIVVGESQDKENILRTLHRING